MPKYEELKNTLLHISENVTALDILLQFEDVLEMSGLYVYENWELGEVVAGPDIQKHWVEVTLMYPYKKMPEPEGGLRLTKIGGKVSMGKDFYEEPVKVSGPSDILDPVTKQAKLAKHKIWLVKIRLPRRIIDQEIEQYLELKDLEYEVDISDIEQGYEQNLDGITDDNNDLLGDLDNEL